MVTNRDTDQDVDEDSILSETFHFFQSKAKNDQYILYWNGHGALKLVIAGGTELISFVVAYLDR